MAAQMHSAPAGLVPAHAHHHHHHPHRHYRHHKPDPRAAAIFWLLVLSMAGSQFALHVWKKRHYRSYQAVTLLGLLLIPMTFSCYLHYWRFVFVWGLFAGMTAYYVREASRNPLPVRAPRHIYIFFFRVYRLSYALGVMGYCIIMFDFFGFRQAFGLPKTFGLIGSSLLFYGLYFGVLDRDCAEMCADRIQQRLGYAKKGDDDPQRLLPDNICALCGLELRPATAIEDDMGDEDEEDNGEEDVIELACGHMFHEFCARGWVMVGKKDACPNCGDKVHLRSLVGSSPWETQSLVWVHLLDALRYLIVWNPVILIVTQVALNGMGLIPHHHHPHGHHPAVGATAPGPSPLQVTPQ